MRLATTERIVCGYHPGSQRTVSQASGHACIMDRLACRKRRSMRPLLQRLMELLTPKTVREVGNSPGARYLRTGIRYLLPDGCFATTYPQSGSCQT